MSTIKNSIRKFMQTAPFVLSNTIIFVPYLLFIGLNDGTMLEKTLPFVLFYTFRMTGIFLLRSFKGTLETFTVLIIAVVFGGLGCLVGLMAQFSFSFYFISAIFLGISASWLPAANTTVNFFEKEQGVHSFKKENSLFALIILVVLIASLSLEESLRMTVVLLEYGALYVAAYHTIRYYPSYEIDFNEVNRKVISIKEFILFAVFFVLLLLIRLARLLFNTEFLMIGVVGFSFLFLIAAWFFNHQRKKWRLAAWLNILTFVTGMCNNFMLLFGTFYVAFRLGVDQIVTHLYIPYILGILLSSLVVKQVQRLVPKMDSKFMYVYGFLISLLLVLVPVTFSLGIFLLSICTSATGSFLNNEFYQETSLPKDERIITKYSTQTKGSIVHQLLLITLLWGLTEGNGLPLVTVLQITQHRVASTSAGLLVEKIHVVSVLLLMFLFLVVYYEMRKTSKRK